jgi:hypothetical protein
LALNFFTEKLCRRDRELNENNILMENKGGFKRREKVLFLEVVPIRYSNGWYSNGST